jgi:xanthine dehydrogenase accessory factor
MDIWNFIKDKLDDDKNCYLLVVIENTVSSPGKQGFKMAVCEDGSLFGSIGGGIMEFEVVEETRKLIEKGEYRSYIRTYFHNNDNSDKLNPGKQIIAVKSIEKNTMSVLRDIISCSGGNNSGIFQMDNTSISFSANCELSKTSYVSEYNDDDNWYYKETTGVTNTIYIIGAGHVGLALSEVVSFLDFNIVLLDDREHHTMLEENKYTHKKIVIDYNDIESYIEEGNNNYAVIMTNKHESDFIVLSKLVNKNIKYLGLLGSKNKRSKFIDRLQSNRISKDKIDRIHIPVGLPINSISPKEIAISIAAEIISVKNK